MHLGTAPLQTGVGSVCLNPPSSCRTSPMCFAVLAAVIAAMNSASTKLSTANDCALDLQTIAPPEWANAHPVVDLLLLRSLAHAESTNPIGFSCAIGSGCCLSSGCMRSGGSDTDSSALLL